MKTAVRIVPAHLVHGFQVEYFCTTEWIDYGPPCADEIGAKDRVNSGIRCENTTSDKFRVVPKTYMTEDFPTQDYVEQMWLNGYQGARRGELNPYAGGMNHTLWEEGAMCWETGCKVFKQ